MKFAGYTLAVAGMCASSALGQTPAITQVENIYSWTLPGLPNYGTARGSIFAIFGTNLSSATVPLQPPPLQTSLNGVRVSVTVNGTTTQPLLYYLSPTQVNAVLPSATPVGSGMLTITNTGGTSAAFPINVVESAFGLLTFNYGAGQVAGFDANNSYAYLGFSSAANPGDVLELWGTGLGPVDDDNTGGPVSDPVEVDIGGVPANVMYHGRSSYTGLDQINVQVPAGLTGCNVSVVVLTGSYASNFGTIPVAADGRTCSDATNPLSTSVLNGIAQSGSLKIGVIGLTESTQPGVTVGGQTIGGGTIEAGFASFLEITYSQLTGGASPSGGAATSPGSCAVNFYNSTSSTAAPPKIQLTYLNAGPDINMSGPDGAITMPLVTEGGIDIYATPASDTSFIPATGGTFTFNNGSGGPDVGAFSSQLDLSAPFTWSNMASLTSIPRSQGLVINWTGGNPNSYVLISGLSVGPVEGSDTNFVVGNFTCQASSAPGTFTVPAAVLESLPASLTLFGATTSNLTVASVTNPAIFNATGLDIGYVAASVQNTIMVTYQ